MAWGLDTYGQLGTNSEREKIEFCGETTCPTFLPPLFSPTAVSGLGDVRSVAAGAGHTLAVLEDSTVEAWGLNEDGQLGTGSATGPEACENLFSRVRPCVDAPVPVEGLTGVTAVAAGETHSLALLADGTVMAWGANGDGQLGTGTSPGPETCQQPGYLPSSQACSSVPVLVPGLHGVRAIAAGGFSSYALLEDGTVMAWGRNEWGELGTGSTGAAECEGSEARCERSPTAVQGLSGATAIAAGEGHALALLSDGTVMGWGFNKIGAVGDGSRENRYSPVAVSGLSGVVSIGAGTDDSIALLGDGTVMDWGSNAYGNLGIGTSTGPERCEEGEFPCSTTPVAVKGLSGVTDVAAGFQHSLALLSNGSVMAWGYNEYGALGTGEPGPESCEPPEEAPRCSKNPVMVAGLTGVKAVAVNAGADDSIAYGPLEPTVTGVTGTEAEAAARTMARSASKPTSGNTGSELGGTRVTISGSDFSGASAVRFGATAAASFTVSASGTIAAVSPPGSGTVNITVITPRGESAVTSGDEFRYVPPIPPVIKKVSPSRGSAAGGTSVMITGTGLGSATVVRFGTVAITEFARSSQSITVVAPPGTAGTAPITVISPNGTSGVSSKTRFIYEGPVVSSLSPGSGPSAGETRVTIIGSGFAVGSGATTFKFGKKPAGTSECASTSMCSVPSPAGKAGTVDVTAAVGRAKSKPNRPGDLFAFE